MKLLIEIPDDYVEELKMQQNFLGMEKEDIIESAFGMARYSIANGIPLEDIKEEIKGYVAENKNSEDLYLAGCGDGAYHILAIINKRISELKGE